VFSSNINGDDRNQGGIRWAISPTCRTGPCDVRLHSKSALYQVKLVYDAKHGQYLGQAHRSDYHSCGTVGIDASGRFKIFPDRARMLNGVWTATVLKGTLTYAIIGSTGGCLPGGLSKLAVNMRRAS
jgi:hypothetical protein